MPNDGDAQLRLYSVMGLCLLSVQMAERMLAGAVEQVLKKTTLAQLMAQSEKEQKRTLGHFIKELRKSVQLEPDLEEKFWRFLKMRNTFIHNLSEVPGWGTHTKEGRDVAFRFLAELLSASFSVAGLSASLFTVSAREEFGHDLIDGDALMVQIEKKFGPIARKILAARNGKPIPLRDGHVFGIDTK